MVRAFLIGAGATRAQYPDAPLSNDFFQILKVRNPLLFQTIDDAIGPYLNEKLQSTSVEIAMQKSYNLPQSARTSFLESLHTSIYELLVNSTESSPTNLQDYIGLPRRPPTLFKTLLNDNRLNKNDFFMSLNYDLYLDREILSIQGKIDYGLGNLLGQVKNIQFCINPEFSIYHLHGSLNWHIRGNRIHVDRGAIIPKYDRSGPNLCIAPPGEKELNPYLKEVWATARERLLRANELIIIGCSLNLDDAELINLVKEFVNRMGSSSVKVIFLPEQIRLQRSAHIPRQWVESDLQHYLNIIGNDARLYPFGFMIKGPPEYPRYGAIEYIFDARASSIQFK